MKKNMFRIGLVLGIIVLFVGASVVPSITGYDKDVENTDYMINENEILNIKKDDYNNLIKQAIESRVISNNDWLEQDKILASDGAEDDYFGLSVSTDGDYVIIGAPGDEDNGDNSGSAYIFKGDGTAWTERAKLLPSDGAAADIFGYSVSIDGDTALIGAYGDDDNGDCSGSAYIFKRDGTAWTEQAKLLTSDGAVKDYFGCSVSTDGDYAIIGAHRDDDNGNDSGSAYIFKRDGTAWTEQAKLLSSDGAEYDLFGRSVSIDGDYAIIGAHRDDDNGNYSGSAYIFTRSGTSWTQQAKLLPSDGAVYDCFGGSVSIDGDYAIIGADGDDDNGDRSGSAYIFKGDGTAWTEQAKLLPSDGAADDFFGFSVSIDDDYCLIGAMGDDDNGDRSGSAYLFRKLDPNAPEAPTISGPNGGKPNTEYDYIFNAVDPNGDEVRYIIDWGDTTSNTTIFAASGTDVTVSHTWTAKGTYVITAKAEDEFGLIGPEATKTVTMPRSRAINTPLLNFFQSHPNLFPILQLLFQRLELH